MRIWSVAVLAAACTLIAARCEADDGPAKVDPTSSYESRTLAGFTVLVNPRVLAHDAEAREALALLEEKLAEVARILPPDRLKSLHGVRIWVEWDQTAGAAQYHPSADWLKAHGYNPDKAGGVEISNVPHFLDWARNAQPMMVLHELSHAYHDKVLGHDYEGINKAYDQAVKGGRYEAVPYILGGVKRAYALTNAEEYFAETTEAYFGVNDFFPFTRDQLRDFDPAGYHLMEDVWGKMRDDVSLTVANGTKKEALLYRVNGRELIFCGRLKPGEEVKQVTSVGRQWQAVFPDEDGQLFTTPGFDTTWRLR